MGSKKRYPPEHNQGDGKKRSVDNPAPNKIWIIQDREKYGKSIKPHIRDGIIKPPRWDNRVSCYAWHHRGFCFKTCPWAYAHSSKASDMPSAAIREHDRLFASAAQTTRGERRHANVHQKPQTHKLSKSTNCPWAGTLSF